MAESRFEQCWRLSLSDASADPWLLREVRHPLGNWIELE